MFKNFKGREEKEFKPGAVELHVKCEPANIEGLGDNLMGMSAKVKGTPPDIMTALDYMLPEVISQLELPLQDELKKTKSGRRTLAETRVKLLKTCTKHAMEMLKEKLAEDLEPEDDELGDELTGLTKSRLVKQKFEDFLDELMKDGE